MSTYAYPGPRFPGPVSVRIRVPDGWTPTATPGSAMAFVDGDVERPGHASSVRSSLVVIVSRLGADATLDELAARLGDEAGAVSGGAVTLGSEVRRVAGRPAIRTVLRLDVARRDGKPGEIGLIQAQTVLALDPGSDGLRQVVQVHLTCPADRWPVVDSAFNDILDSLEIG